MRKTEQKDKVQRFWTQAKNQQIKDGIHDTEGKLVVFPKDTSKRLLPSGLAINRVAVNDLAVLSNKPKAVKKMIFTTSQDIDKNAYPTKARIYINRFLPALWPVMDAVAKLHKFKVINSLRYFKGQNSMKVCFIKLSSSTVQKRIDRKGKPQYLLSKVYFGSAQCWVSDKRKISALQNYPHLIFHIKDTIYELKRRLYLSIDL